MIPLGSAARWGLVVAVAFVAFHTPHLARRYEPNSWLFADGAFYFTTTRSLAEHGRLEQRELHPQSWYVADLSWNKRLDDAWSNVALGRDGGWYPKHPVLLPALAVPLYLLAGTPGTLWTNVLLNLAFVLLVFLLCRRVARVEIAALAAIAVCAMPFVQRMSYTFSNDLLGAVLILGALESTFARRFGLAGVLFGLSLWSRVTNAAFLPAFLVLGAAQGGWRAVGRAALFACLPLSVYAALNTWMFGAPWITSYQSVLVRENGVPTTASHTRLFNVPFATGLRRIVLGKDGAFASFPLLAPGLLGLFASARTRRSWAVGLLLAALLPLLAFVTYDWYRPHFLYPVYGLSAMGLASLAALVWRRRDERPERVWRIPAVAVAALALLVAGALLAHRFSHRRDPAQLSSHLESARVYLGSIPCDYFNPQNERWECSRYDKGGWAMTGRILGDPVRVGGEPQRGIWMHPHTSRRWRRLVFPDLEATSVDLRLALGDRTRAGPVEIELLARGSPPVRLSLDKAGDVAQRTLTLSPGDGDALEIRARADTPDWKHLVVEGQLTPAR